MGIFIKTCVIVVDIILLLLLLVLEILLVIGFVAWPILMILLYKNLDFLIISILCILAIFLIFKPKKKWIDSISGKSTLEIVKELLSRQDILFVLQKAEIIKSEIQLLDVPKEELFKDANDKTPLDIFASYL